MLPDQLLLQNGKINMKLNWESLNQHLLTLPLSSPDSLHFTYFAFTF